MTETSTGPGVDSPAVAPAAGQYLSCWMGGQEFALPVTAVREIRALGAWSVLPGGPAWVMGVMNLRGLVIPLIDLRLRLCLPPAEQDGPRVMVVVALGSRLAGLVVDGVQEVVELTPGEPSGSGRAVPARLVAGLASAEDRVVIILNVDALAGRQSFDGQRRDAGGAGGAGEREHVELVR